MILSFIFWAIVVFTWLPESVWPVLGEGGGGQGEDEEEDGEALHFFNKNSILCRLLLSERMFLGSGVVRRERRCLLYADAAAWCFPPSLFP